MHTRNFSASLSLDVIISKFRQSVCYVKKHLLRHNHNFLCKMSLIGMRIESVDVWTKCWYIIHISAWIQLITVNYSNKII